MSNDDIGCEYVEHILKSFSKIVLGYYEYLSISLAIAQ